MNTWLDGETNSTGEPGQSAGELSSFQLQGVHHRKFVQKASPPAVEQGQIGRPEGAVQAEGYLGYPGAIATQTTCQRLAMFDLGLDSKLPPKISIYPTPEDTMQVLRKRAANPSCPAAVTQVLAGATQR